MRLVAEYADRCVAMKDGRIIFEGRPHELFSSPKVLTAAKLKAPPVFEFSRELLGESTLGTAKLIDQLEARFGRPGAVVQGS
jgi:ABC-type glutathione transport system ATPase component